MRGFIRGLTQDPGEIDSGDQFIDAASQTAMHPKRATPGEMMPEIKALTRRLNLCRDGNLRLKPKAG